jgi:hypothetical protein
MTDEVSGCAIMAKEAGMIPLSPAAMRGARKSAAQFLSGCDVDVTDPDVVAYSTEAWPYTVRWFKRAEELRKKLGLA